MTNQVFGKEYADQYDTFYHDKNYEAECDLMEEIVARKRWMGQAYTERLGDVPGLQLPVEQPWARQVYWMYGIVLDESAGMNASEFAQRLQKLEVQTRPFFLGMHEQPVFLERGLFQNELYPVAERIARQGLYLPSGMTLKESDIDKVCKAVETALNL